MTDGFFPILTHSVNLEKFRNSVKIQRRSPHLGEGGFEEDGFGGAFAGAGFAEVFTAASFSGEFKQMTFEIGRDKKVCFFA
jgi:hypothetical protein